MTPIQCNSNTGLHLKQGAICLLNVFVMTKYTKVPGIDSSVCRDLNSAQGPGHTARQLLLPVAQRSLPRGFFSASSPYKLSSVFHFCARVRKSCVHREITELGCHKNHICLMLTFRSFLYEWSLWQAQCRLIVMAYLYRHASRIKGHIPRSLVRQSS